MSQNKVSSDGLPTTRWERDEKSRIIGRSKPALKMRNHKSGWQARDSPFKVAWAALTKRGRNKILGGDGALVKRTKHQLRLVVDWSWLIGLHLYPLHALLTKVYLHRVLIDFRADFSGHGGNRLAVSSSRNSRPETDVGRARQCLTSDVYGAEESAGGAREGLGLGLEKDRVGTAMVGTT